MSASSGVFSCRSPCPARIPSQRTQGTSRGDRPIRFWSKAAFFLSVKISNEQPPLSLPSAFPGSRNVLVSSSTSPLPGLYCDRCGNGRLRQTALTGRIEGGLFQKKKKKKVVRELKATGSRAELQPLVRGDRFYCFVL